jgi:hypothetical protein
MAAKSKPTGPDIWTRFRVSFLGLTPLCGSVPSDPEIIKAWLNARQPRVKPPGARSMQEINEEVLASLERGEEYDPDTSQILVFQRDGDACCVRYDTLRAHIKDCARVVSGHTGREKGERSFATKAVNGLYTDARQYWVPVLRPDGEPVTKHDEEIERAIHPRPGVSALKKFERIKPWRIDFTLKVLTMGGQLTVKDDDLHIIFTYGGSHGYSGERGADGGKYDYTLTRLAD